MGADEEEHEAPEVDGKIPDDEGETTEEVGDVDVEALGCVGEDADLAVAFGGVIFDFCRD